MSSEKASETPRGPWYKYQPELDGKPRWYHTGRGISVIVAMMGAPFLFSAIINENQTLEERQEREVRAVLNNHPINTAKDKKPKNPSVNNSTAQAFTVAGSGIAGATNKEPVLAAGIDKARGIDKTGTMFIIGNEQLENTTREKNIPATTAGAKRPGSTLNGKLNPRAAVSYNTPK